MFNGRGLWYKRKSELKYLDSTTNCKLCDTPLVSADDKKWTNRISGRPASQR